MEAPEPDEDGMPEEGFVFVLEKATLEAAKVGKVRDGRYRIDVFADLPPSPSPTHARTHRRLCTCTRKRMCCSR